MSAQPNPVPGYPPNYSTIANNTIPEGLELLQAHVYFRHGERTPVKERLAHLGVPRQWNLCSAGKEFAAGVLNDPGESGKSKRLMLMRTGFEAGNANRPIAADRDRCAWGELTDTGRLSTLRLGQELRKLYVDNVGLLPSTITPETAQSIHLRSTAVPRAVESMQQVLHGFIPQQDARYVPSVLIRSPFDESLYPNTTCPLYRALDKKYVKEAAAKWDDKLLKPLDSKIAGLVGVPVRIQSHPTANGVLDTIRGCQAHNIPVPEAFKDPQVSENLEAAVVHEWFTGYVDKQFSRLSMGRLLGDLAARLEDRIRDSRDPLKLGLYACHDTTVAGILNVLQCFDNRWPYFTAYFAVELMRKKKPETGGLLGGMLSFGNSAAEKDTYVRLKYNNNDLTIPACAATGKHLEGSNGSICTFAAFKEAIKDVVMTSEEWHKECQQPLPTTA